MKLNKFILTNFKNYEHETIDCSATLTCFVGNNGMGKTNLLDAVYYLCMGKSYFNLPDRLICRHDTDFFRLEGHFELEGRPEHIAAKVRPRQKKELERNKVPYHRLSEHVGLLPIVMIAPDDTYLATEGSEARRRFLDNTLSQLDAVYLNQLILYNKILKQRNALLKRAGETRRLDKALLDTYTYQLLKPGQYIYQRRSEFMEQFQPRLQQLYEEISGGQEQVGIQYRSKLADAPLEQLLQSSEEKDRLLQRTTAGPHKDDLEFDIQEYPLKRFASQGQLKSYVLALKLAQYQVLRAEKKLSPFLLLDDIFDKLDNNRVSQLLGVLLQKEYGQLFITDTDDQRLKHIIEQYEQSYTQYTIEHGKAEQTAGK